MGSWLRKKRGGRDRVSHRGGKGLRLRHERPKEEINTADQQQKGEYVVAWGDNRRKEGPKDSDGDRREGKTSSSLKEDD